MRASSIFCLTASMLVGGTMSAQQVVVQPGSDRDDAGSDEAPVCFEHRRPRSVTPIDDRYVYVQARGADNHYLLEMEGCFGLRGALRFSFARTRSSRICPGDNARLVYQPINSNATTTCLIRDVTAVESLDDAESLAASLLGGSPRQN